MMDSKELNFDWQKDFRSATEHLVAKNWLSALLIGVISGFMGMGCANLGPSEESGLSVLEDEEEIPQVPSKSRAGQSGYSMGATKHTASWVICNHNNPVGAMIVVQGELADFQGIASCNEGLAQAFLSEQYSVLLIPRPGSMGTSGANDLGGPLTLASVVTAVKSVTMQPNPLLNGKLNGFWGYGSGAGVAALAARQLGSPGFLIIGGGFYDYEDVLAKTQFQPLKEAITKIKQTTGDKGIEFRSVAYDISKLPKSIYAYHGSLDQVAPMGQARAFADSLRTSGEYQVTFKVLEGTGHWLKTSEQQHVIRTILQSQKNAAAPAQNE